MITLSVMMGIGNKARWMFLCQGDRGDIIKGFKTGGLQAVKAYLTKKYMYFTLGEILGKGDNRRRLIYVEPYPIVAPHIHKETESDRMLANAQSAHTQLKAWRWEGLK